MFEPSKYCAFSYKRNNEMQIHITLRTFHFRKLILKSLVCFNKIECPNPYINVKRTYCPIELFFQKYAFQNYASICFTLRDYM